MLLRDSLRSAARSPAGASQARSAAAFSSIRFAEAVTRVGHGERTVLLRGNLDPIGFAVMRGRGWRIRSGGRSGDGGDGHARRRVIGRIRDEHSGYRVLLAAQ